MELIVGQRVRFVRREAGIDGPHRSSIRPGETWEGSVVAIEGDLVTILVELLNGMRTDAIKTVHREDVSWM